MVNKRTDDVGLCVLGVEWAVWNLRSLQTHSPPIHKSTIQGTCTELIQFLYTRNSWEIFTYSWNIIQNENTVSGIAGEYLQSEYNTEYRMNTVSGIAGEYLQSLYTIQYRVRE